MNNTVKLLERFLDDRGSGGKRKTAKKRAKRPLELENKPKHPVPQKRRRTEGKVKHVVHVPAPPQLEEPEQDDRPKLLECTICLEEMSSVGKRQVHVGMCGHLLCKACAGVLVSTKAASCPICKAPIGARQRKTFFHPIFGLPKKQYAVLEPKRVEGLEKIISEQRQQINGLLKEKEKCNMDILTKLRLELSSLRTRLAGYHRETWQLRNMLASRMPQKKT